MRRTVIPLAILWLSLDLGAAREQDRVMKVAGNVYMLESYDATTD
jgi:hypothetical protein